MKEFLKKFKESEVYEILEDQSAIIIFIATLFGSLLSLSGKICHYMYSLGRFQALTIPTYLINQTDFSFGDIFSIFATIFCFGAAVITMIATYMLVSGAYWKQKTRYKYLKKLKEFMKNLMQLLVASVGCLIPLIFINIFLIVLLFEINFITLVIGVPLFVLFEFFMARTILKERETQSKDNSTLKIENEAIEEELKSKMTEKEFSEYCSKKEKHNKNIKISIVLFSVMFPVLIISILGLSQYNSGKNSAIDETKFYQIYNIEKTKDENIDKCKVVLAKCKEGYIVSNAYILEQEKDCVLEISRHNQQVVSLVDVEYENIRFSKICLEDSK